MLPTFPEGLGVGAPCSLSVRYRDGSSGQRSFQGSGIRSLMIIEGSGVGVRGIED